MYELIKKFQKGTVCRFSPLKNRRFKTIHLDVATQEELKLIYDADNNGIVKYTEKKKVTK